MSDRYAKILKKYDVTGKNVTSLHFFDRDDGFAPGSSYFTKMVELSKLEYTQIILNSELLIQLSIVLKTHNYKILDIELEDYADDENSELKDLFISVINQAKKEISENEISLWFLQRESILISKISVTNLDEMKKIEINRSGLLFGDEESLLKMYDNILSTTINEYIGG